MHDSRPKSKVGQVALVSGANGFIGRHLVSRLVREGWGVHVVVREGTDTSVFSTMGAPVTLHQHDGTTCGLHQIVSSAAPVIIFHLASLFLSDHKPEDVDRLIASNILFATQLAEAMTRSGVRELVNTGTSWQHYQGREYSPVNLYAATKQAFESILQFYVETTPLRVVTLKLYDTYGPGDKRQKLFHLLRQVAERQEPLAMSPGEQLIDLVYVDDVIDAFLCAARILGSNMVDGHASYAVSSGSPIRLKDLVACYAKLLGKELPIQWGGRDYRCCEVMEPWHTGATIPGWSPQVSLEVGLRRLIDEYLSRPTE